MRKKKTIWTIEKSKEEALKYKHKVDFKKNSNRAYTVLCKNGLIEESCKHMTKPEVCLLWTKEKCIEAAQKCKTKSEFSKRYCGAYNSAKKHGWFDEIIQFFIPLGSKYKRCIYACVFNDNKVYIGLTYNFEKRKKQHLSDKDSAVYQHIQKTGLAPLFLQITDYIDYRESSQKEGEILKEYIDKGLTPLNRTATGGLGSKDEVIARKWTKEKCIEAASQCDSYKDFRENYSGAYEACVKYGIINKIKNILPPECTHKLWTIETALNEFDKYETLKEFRENSSGCYSFLLKKGIFKQIRNKKILLQRDAWTFEEAHQEALKYDNKKDFRENKNGCYCVCEKRGWLSKVCSHMRDLNKERIIYTEDFVISMLKNFEYMEQLKKSDDKTVRGCYWWMKKHKKLKDFKKFLK